MRGQVLPQNMIAVTEREGYRVVHGDTDSIFAWVKGTTPDECMELGIKLREAIDGSMQGPRDEVLSSIKNRYVDTLGCKARSWNRGMERVA